MNGSEIGELERLSSFLQERLKMACIALTVGSLIVLAIVLPHADRCLSEALGRDVWEGDAEVMR